MKYVPFAKELSGLPEVYQSHVIQELERTIRQIRNHVSQDAIHDLRCMAFCVKIGTILDQASGLKKNLDSA